MENNIKKECQYVYNWVTLLYSRDWHNIVNQLYFNLKKKRKKMLFVSLWKKLCPLKFTKIFCFLFWVNSSILLHCVFCACFACLLDISQHVERVFWWMNGWTVLKRVMDKFYISSTLRFTNFLISDKTKEYPYIGSIA